ncbi:hypothetical protein POM88_006286 [Heracleum sosnowskyi]|uniref:Uncharacterized protein n=1 Tax=Heracleum sosnowskyi TaxID=360622 RepID=A0AAD8N6C3_9APIA|nr:hypothetical protein POM88_006286 [Heracleum sosnowskyi]
MDDDEQLHAEEYVLLNSPEVQPYLRRYQNRVMRQRPETTPQDLDRIVKTRFKTWLKKKVENDEIEGPRFKDLLEGPSLRVMTFETCQAAHHLKIKSLMDQTCQTLVNRVKENSASAILMQKFDTKQEYDHLAPKRLKRHSYISVNANSQDPKLDKYVPEFLKLSNFLVTGNYLKRIKFLCLTLEPNQRSFVYLSSKIDPPVTTAIEELRSAMGLIHIVTGQDLALADLLSSEVASRLVLILNSIDLFDIKAMKPNQMPPAPSDVSSRKKHKNTCKVVEELHSVVESLHRGDLACGITA